jgi:propionate catabolism operon transcriptional regulator
VAAIAADLLRRALSRHRAPDGYAPALALVVPHLERHEWPGNVRELENVLERIAVLYAARGTGPVGLDDVRAVVPELFDAEPSLRPARSAGPSAPPAPDGDLRAARGAQEQAHIRRVLAECGGNQTAAARRLGIGRATLWRKLTSAR